MKAKLVNMKKIAAPALPEDPASLQAFIDAAAAQSGLSVDQAYRASITIHLNAVTNAAKLVLAFQIKDEAEPGPVFRP